jgi:hypothetical protein
LRENGKFRWLPASSGDGSKCDIRSTRNHKIVVVLVQFNQKGNESANTLHHNIITAVVVLSIDELLIIPHSFTLPASFKLNYSVE